MTYEERRLIEAAPKLTDEEKRAINALFPAYIFRRSKTRELWTTCCRKHKSLPKAEKQTQAEIGVMAADHQREPRDSRFPEPKPSANCPYCGAPVIVKELGRTGDRKNLNCYRRAVVLRWHQGSLWAVAYSLGKDYADADKLIKAPWTERKGVYRFQPGLAEETIFRWCGVEYDAQNGPLTGGKWHIHSPFSCNFEYGTGYDVIGLEEIEKSPFRYCGAEKYKGSLLKFLAACCFYPRQIEMLMKAGMLDVVRDLAEYGIKNAAAIDWTQNPTRAFGLNKQELKEFLETERNIDTIALYKRLKRRVPISEAAQWVQSGANVEETLRQARKWNLPPEKLFRYCQRAKRGPLESSLACWKDYITAAQALGYPLHRENVLLPADLWEAHDEATEKHRAKLRREREASEAEARKLRAATYVQRKEELEKKYAYAADGLLIRVPAGEDEIIREGACLKHCVAGYAERHVKGAVTILFLREEKRPNSPFLTIEMAGNRLVQIHGYKNEGLHTKQGRFAPDPRETYKDFLDTWLDWLKNGSKRNKDGTPKLTKGRRKAAELQKGA